MGKIFDLFRKTELGPDEEKRLKEDKKLVRQRDEMAGKAFAGELEPITTKWPEETISPEQKAEILMAAERLYTEYQEKITLEEMTVDQAIEDVEKKCQDQQINQEVKNEVVKKLMLLAEQPK